MTTNMTALATMTTATTSSECCGGTCVASRAHAGPRGAERGGCCRRAAFLLLDAPCLLPLARWCVVCCLFNVQNRYPARPSKASFRDALEGEALYGVAPIQAALRAGIRQPHALLVQEGVNPAARKDAAALSEIKRLAAAAGAVIRGVSKHELNMLSGNRYGYLSACVSVGMQQLCNERGTSPAAKQRHERSPLADLTGAAAAPCLLTAPV